MYQVDELIDHIRELESKVNSNVLYSVIVSGVCMHDPDPWTYVHKTVKDLKSLGNPNDIIKSVVQEISYHPYLDNRCCEEEGCCGEPEGLESYIETYLNDISPNAYSLKRYTEELEKDIPMDNVQSLYLTHIYDERDETNYTISIFRLRGE